MSCYAFIYCLDIYFEYNFNFFTLEVWVSKSIKFSFPVSSHPLKVVQENGFFYETVTYSLNDSPSALYTLHN